MHPSTQLAARPASRWRLHVVAPDIAVSVRNAPFGAFSQARALTAMLPRLDLNQKPCD